MEVADTHHGRSAGSLSGLGLWLALGPAAWALHLQGNYALVKLACATGHPLLLTLVSIAAFVVTAGSAAMAWTYAFALQPTQDVDATPPQRNYFLALVGVGLNSLMAMHILISALTPLVLSPCE